MGGYLLTITRIPTVTKVDVPVLKSSKRISDQELEESRGRDDLVIQYHAAVAFRELKEAVDEREDQD